MAASKYKRIIAFATLIMTALSIGVRAADIEDRVGGADLVKVDFVFGNAVGFGLGFGQKIEGADHEGFGIFGEMCLLNELGDIGQPAADLLLFDDKIDFCAGKTAPRHRFSLPLPAGQIRLFQFAQEVFLIAAAIVSFVVVVMEQKH